MWNTQLPLHHNYHGVMHMTVYYIITYRRFFLHTYTYHTICKLLMINISNRLASFVTTQPALFFIAEF